MIKYDIEWEAMLSILINCKIYHSILFWLESYFLALLGNVNDRNYRINILNNEFSLYVKLLRVKI